MANLTIFKKLLMAATGAVFMSIGMVAFGIENAKASTITFTAISSDELTKGCVPTLNPESRCFVEDGFNVEGFWADNIASELQQYRNGHFHNNGLGYENQHYVSTNALEGFLIKKTDGSNFSLRSLDYFLRSDAFKIEDYFRTDVKVLISTSFDLSKHIASQFTEFSIDNTLDRTFKTLAITGFENVNQLFISSSAAVAFDNLKIDSASKPVLETDAIPASKSVPEPASITALLGFGVLGASSLLKRKQQQKTIL